MTDSDTMPVKSRLTCSIVWFGVAEADQLAVRAVRPVSQPRPEPVRRTAAPVTTIAASSTRANTVTVR